MMVLKQQPDYFTKRMAFYLNGVLFIHKYNPKAEALSPKGRVWRKKHEGLTTTGKGSKNLPGGRRVHLIVAIS